VVPRTQAESVCVEAEELLYDSESRARALRSNQFEVYTDWDPLDQIHEASSGSGAPDPE
jgi:hypothetical protein